MSRRAHVRERQRTARAGAEARLSFDREAQRNGQKARARWHATRGRPLATNRDPDEIEIRIKPKLVKQVLDLVRSDGQLVLWVDSLIAASYKRPGAPAQLRTETFIVGCCLQAITQRNLHLINVPHVLANMHWRDRQTLGVDIINRRNGQPSQITHDHVLGAMERLERVFDIHAPDIDDNERTYRLNNVCEFANRIARLCVPATPYSGDYAVDATLKWAWARPPEKKGKVVRNGADGDGGSPMALSDMVDVTDPNSFEQPDDETLPAAPNVVVSRVPSLDRDASWVGRANLRKVVFGYQFDTVVRSDGTSPAFMEQFAVARASADPVRTLLPALRNLADLRMLNAHTIAPGGQPIRHLVADAAYSRSVEVLDEYRALGAIPVFKPHSTNQPPLSYIGDRKPGGAGWAIVNGRPYCPCCPPSVADQLLPSPFATQAERAHHHRLVEMLAPYAMTVNITYKDGAIQYLAPHKQGPDNRRGGCMRCVQPDGTPVIEPVTGVPRARCCTQPTRKFSATELAMWQPEVVGSPAWDKIWARRNPVEGKYGILKDLATINWGRPWHRLTGLVREWITFGFAGFAYNWHIARSFEAAARKAGFTDDTDDRPSGNTYHPVDVVEPPQPAPMKITAALADLAGLPPPPA